MTRQVRRGGRSQGAGPISKKGAGLPFSDDQFGVFAIDRRHRARRRRRRRRGADDEVNVVVVPILGARIADVVVDVDVDGIR